MNLRAIDLNLLPVFDAIYGERSLTRASETLAMTQPAVSNALARLRAALGDPLFVRSGRGMAPTPAAEALAGPVHEALMKLRVGLDPGAKFDPSASERTFRVSLRGDTGASEILPRLSRRLESTAPHVRLLIRQFDRAEIPHEFAAGRIDLAVDTPDLARTELASAPLISDRYVCVLRKGHAAAKSNLTLKRFLALRHVMVSSRPAGRGLIDIALQRIGERVQPVLRLPHFQAGLHVVMASDAAMVAPLSLAKRYDVAWRDLPFEAPPLDMLLFWRRDAAEEPAARWLREEVLAAVRRRQGA